MNNKPLQEQPAFIRASKEEKDAVKKYEDLAESINQLTSQILEKSADLGATSQKLNYQKDELAIAEMELHVAQIRLNEMCRKEGDLSDKYMEGDDLAYENHDHLAGEGEV